MIKINEIFKKFKVQELCDGFMTTNFKFMPQHCSLNKIILQNFLLR